MPLGNRVYITSVRGPASYAAGGFSATMGDIERIGEGSGRMIGAMLASSGLFTVEVASHSGNIATLIVRTASGAQLADTTDLSPQHFTLIYGEGT